MASIQVSRDAVRWQDRLRRYRVFVDELEAARIRAGESVSCEVETGVHEVQIFIDRWSSEPISVSLESENDTVRLRCGPKGGMLGMRAIGKPDSYIWLVI